MSDHILHRSLTVQLLRARESVMRYFRKNLKKFGLTEQQWRVIRVLDEHGELEIRRIAEETCILAPSLSGVLDRMARDGLIVRHRISTDQRKVFVDLTAKSRKLVAQLSGLVDEQYRTLEKLVGQKSFAALHELLDQLIALPGPEAVERRVIREKLPVKRIKHPVACD
jgi:homoprotocatechuate degradation regulator HpaR